MSIVYKVYKLYVLYNVHQQHCLTWQFNIEEQEIKG